MTFPVARLNVKWGFDIYDMICFNTFMILLFCVILTKLY